MRVTRWRLLVGAAVVLLAMPSPVSAQDDPCAGAQVRVVAEGLGTLENLEPDGAGGMLVSSTDRNAIERVLPDGSVSTALAEVDRPGGLRLRDDGLWFTTGNGAASGVLSTPDGTLQRADLATGDREVMTTGLVMPNGLVFDDTGDAYVSRDLGLDASITRIPAGDRADPEPGWADIADSNGLAVDPTGTFLYASSTFNLPASLFRVTIDDPSEVEEIMQFMGVGSPVPKGLDDLTIDGDGVLYLTANASGELIRYDPATGDACVLTAALMTPSAVKFGTGDGFSSNALYVVGFDGRLVEVTLPMPPSDGVDPVVDPVPDPTTQPEPSDTGSPVATPAPGPSATTAPSPAAPTTRTPASAGPSLPITGGGVTSAAILLGLGAASSRRRD